MARGNAKTHIHTHTYICICLQDGELKERDPGQAHLVPSKSRLYFFLFSSVLFFPGPDLNAHLYSYTAATASARAVFERQTHTQTRTNHPSQATEALRDILREGKEACARPRNRLGGEGESPSPGQ